MTADSVSTSLTAVIVVDHGSRRDASNQLLLDAAKLVAQSGPWRIVEPAHMELAPPDLATAFARCVERGARRVIVFPWFLSPGRHWSDDIPSLVAAAAAPFPQIEWLVTAPFGLHPGLLAIVHDRIEHCLNEANSSPDSPRTFCDVCLNASPCRLHRN